jgi:hypothetical protein
MASILLEKGMRIYIIILAVITAIVIVHFILVPYVLKPLSFINTNESLKIFYKTNGNTAIIFVEPVNRWILYNDNKIYTFTPENTGRHCDDPKFSLAYVIDSEGNEIGYSCIQNVDDIIREKYSVEKDEWSILFHRLDFTGKTGTISEQILTSQDIINILLKNRIIFN